MDGEWSNRKFGVPLSDFWCLSYSQLNSSQLRLRAPIKAAAPDCTERVSYKTPILRLQRDFVAMSAARRHCGLHTMSKAIPVATKDELKGAGIWISVTTLPIKTDYDLPMPLIKRVWRAPC